jgi:hypothetical protein
MQFKVFGSDGPPDDLADDLKILFTLDPPAWESLAKWFLTTDSFDVEGSLSSPTISASAMLPEQFRKCARGILDLLEDWHASNLQLPDLQHDLLILGFSTQEIDRLGSLLERLRPVKIRAYTDLMRFEHENSALPTLEDIDVVCDIRPIFEDAVYPIPEKSAMSHTKLLGFSYVVLMELLAEDFEGKTSKLSFQMTERGLAKLQAALQRAREQLDILKVSTNALSTEHH